MSVSFSSSMPFSLGAFIRAESAPRDGSSWASGRLKKIAVRAAGTAKAAAQHVGKESFKTCPLEDDAGFGA